MGLHYVDVCDYCICVRDIAGKYVWGRGGVSSFRDVCAGLGTLDCKCKNISVLHWWYRNGRVGGGWQKCDLVLRITNCHYNLSPWNKRGMGMGISVEQSIRVYVLYVYASKCGGESILSWLLHAIPHSCSRRSRYIRLFWRPPDDTSYHAPTQIHLYNLPLVHSFLPPTLPNNASLYSFPSHSIPTHNHHQR